MNRKIRLALFFWLPAAAWAFLISYFSSLSAEQLPKIDIPNFDKMIHLLEYLTLGLLTMRASVNTFPKVNLKKLLFFTIIITLSYAVTDELRQRTVSGRSCEIFDLLADLAGITMGIFLYRRTSAKCRR